MIGHKTPARSSTTTLYNKPNTADPQAVELTDIYALHSVLVSAGVIMKIVIAALAAILLSGCVAKYGIMLPISTGPTQNDLDDAIRRNETKPSEAASTPLQGVLKTALIADEQGARLIIVGNVMPLSSYDESTLNQHYDTMLKSLATASKQPPFTREWFLATCSGETAVKYSGITVIYHKHFRALVPKDIVKGINFSSTFGTFMFGTSGDLVVAQATSQGGPWITHVLCSEKDNSYSTCEQQYQPGIYQSIDSREIDIKLKVKEGGAVIDTATYKKR